MIDFLFSLLMSWVSIWKFWCSVSKQLNFIIMSRQPVLICCYNQFVYKPWVPGVLIFILCVFILCAIRVPYSRNLYTLFLRARKLDLRLNILIFQQRPGLKMLLFSCFKYAFFALLTMHTISKRFLCKIFIFLHLLVIRATCKF